MTELQELLSVCISANLDVFISTVTHKLLLEDLRDWMTMEVPYGPVFPI